MQCGDVYMWGHQADNKMALHNAAYPKEPHVCFEDSSIETTAASDKSWGIFSPAWIPPTPLDVCPPVLSQPWGGGAANLVCYSWNGNPHFYVHTG